MDFQGAKISLDTGFLLMREIDQRFNILSDAASRIDDPGSPRHADHSLLQLLRRRICQVAAGCEDCNDAGYLRLNPALRLAPGKEHDCADGGMSSNCPNWSDRKFSCGFLLEYRMIYGRWAFQKLFRTEPDQEIG
jgi:hypothetical protein